MAPQALRPSRFLGSETNLRVSMEFFPPKTDEMEETLWRSVERLAPLSPSFVSVTYGAGGSTRERTHHTLKRILAETDLKPAAHLTCVAASRDDVDAVVRAYGEAGIHHIVALRGDPAGGVGTRYEPHPQGYANAAELVAGIRRLGDFEISVAAYPEKHPESPGVAADIEMLKRKVDAGATHAITQFFFDNDLFEAYVEKVRAAGIDIPVAPGKGLENDPATRQLVAAAVAAEQVLDLIDRGFTDLHFYTMNRADLVYAICHLLGMRPKGREVKEAAA
ncbi:MAG: methylenetetrahydrofolate reductase [Rhizobiales bacterium]|nr:methylenetetrahydrofolate reductase [Hyphomicrobiales bacterium]